MKVGVLGANHTSLDLRQRELFARLCTKLFSPENLEEKERGFVLLSTCNRTEIYFSGEDLALTHSFILSLLRKELPTGFDNHFYSYFAADCFLHLAQVTLGMNSAIIAETEIQGQVKSAYEAAKSHLVLSSTMHFMFQKALKVGKKIRTDLQLGRGMPDLEQLVFSITKKHFPDLSDKRVLFVGASEVNCKIIPLFQAEKPGSITICNRSSQRKKILQENLGIEVKSWNYVSFWQHYDVVILGTKCPDYLLRAMDWGESKHIVIVDLSIPRNADPLLGGLPYVHLYNIDEVDEMVRSRRQLKLEEVEEVSRELKLSCERQLGLFYKKQNAKEKLLALRELAVVG